MLNGRSFERNEKIGNFFTFRNDFQLNKKPVNI